MVGDTTGQYMYLMLVVQDTMLHLKEIVFPSAHTNLSFPPARATHCSFLCVHIQHILEESCCVLYCSCSIRDTICWPLCPLKGWEEAGETCLVVRLAIGILTSLEFEDWEIQSQYLSKICLSWKNEEVITRSSEKELLYSPRPSRGLQIVYYD